MTNMLIVAAGRKLTYLLTVQELLFLCSEFFVVDDSALPEVVKLDQFGIQVALLG